MNTTKTMEVGGIPVAEIWDPEKLQASPLVSVAITTYNHEKWIAEAIEGVLMQKIDFPIELVISEDCSTDNTRAIVLDYQKRYPQLIRLLLPEKNLGCGKNGPNLLKQCHGTYIALCEGDDYWTNPAKLQKQVALLKEDPQCALCVALTETIDDRDGKKTPTGVIIGKTHKAHLTFEDMGTGYWHTSSYLLSRQKYLEAIRRWERIRMYDVVMLMILTDQHHAVFLNEVVSVYRSTGTGIYSGASAQYKIYSNIEIYDQWRKLLGKKWKKTLAKRLIGLYEMACSWELHYGNKLQLIKCLWKWGCLKGRYQPIRMLKDIIKYPFQKGRMELPS